LAQQSKTTSGGQMMGFLPPQYKDIRDRWHAMTKTGKMSPINDHKPTPFEINLLMPKE
jgi:hypothetical protein